MKHFSNVQTLDEAKKLYRELAKLHHPDRGGDTAIMQEVNKEYDFICSKILKGENLNTEEFNEAWDNINLFREKINAIINLPGIQIEIVNLWLWVTGETREVKDILKAAGFYWASKKLAWYWRPESAAGGRGKMSLDEVRAKYGSTKVTGQNYQGFKQFAA
jgi:hypothetical protein